MHASHDEVYISLLCCDWLCPYHASVFHFGVVFQDESRYLQVPSSSSWIMGNISLVRCLVNGGMPSQISLIWRHCRFTIKILKIFGSLHIFGQCEKHWALNTLVWGHPVLSVNTFDFHFEALVVELITAASIIVWKMNWTLMKSRNYFFRPWCCIIFSLNLEI